MSRQGESFLSRWSRRKSGSEGDAAGAASLPAALRATAPLSESPVPDPESRGEPACAPASGATALPQSPAEPPLPTMDDVSALTRSSDYSRFVQPGVEPGVRNAAMKKLFSDPHFNVMDGLDTYIDDYGKPDPIPPSMLRLMNQAATLRLFENDPEAPAGAATGADPVAPAAAVPPGALACPDGDAPHAVAQSEPPLSTVPPPALASCPDDDADLRLQPDDAPRRRGPEPGAGA